MKKGIQLVALLLAAFMGSCTGGKDKAAVAAQADEKPIVKLADVKVRPVDQIQDYTATVEAEVKNKMLQRIYGTAITKKAELEEYLQDRKSVV